ncbi:MAG: SDR family oxidoreductase [Janthinobacterium lividum]
MARYLITGMAGFIGSTLARALLERGHTVRGIDNLSTGRMENLSDILSSVEFEIADLQDESAMRFACDGVDFVLHQAALASVPRSVKDPLTSHASNINGTLSLLMAARDAGVKRIVYAASSSAYGDQEGLAKHEEMTPRPLSPYAVQKLTCEHYLQAFCRVYGMEGICLRYFNIFGPRQAADSPYSGVIARFAYQMMAGETPSINGDGMVSRDFNFVENAVQANLLACLAPSQYANGRVYNVGTGQTHTLNELYWTLAEIFGFSEKPKYGALRAGDILHSQADISRAKSELGYQPKVSFREGLEKTASWYLSEVGTKLTPA